MIRSCLIALCVSISLWNVARAQIRKHNQFYITAERSQLAWQLAELGVNNESARSYRYELGLVYNEFLSIYGGIEQPSYPATIQRNPYSIKMMEVGVQYNLIILNTHFEPFVRLGYTMLETNMRTITDIDLGIQSSGYQFSIGLQYFYWQKWALYAQYNVGRQYIDDSEVNGNALILSERFPIERIGFGIRWYPMRKDDR